MKVNGKRVFLSGPMSGISHYNAQAFLDAHVMLKEAGALSVYDPAIEWLESDEDHDHAYWMRKCLRELTADWPFNLCRGYDILVQLPGWEDSVGASTEYEVAKACGIAVCELSEVE